MGGRLLSWPSLGIGYVSAWWVAAVIVDAFPGCRPSVWRIGALAAWFVAAGTVATVVHGLLFRLPLKRIALRTALFAGRAGLVTGTCVSNMGALDLGRQKWTVRDMRAVGAALERYRAANGRYPAAVGDVASVEHLLVPTHVRKLPMRDGWGEPLLIRSSATSYTLVSHGLCGEPDVAEWADTTAGATTDYQRDIVFSAGHFVVWPEGTAP